MIGRIAEVWRYPVKSMAGERLAEAALDELGLVGDRRFGVVDLATEHVLSAKRFPQLLEARARWVAGRAEITLPGAEPLEPLGADDRLSAWLGRPVRLEAADASRPRHFEMALSLERDDVDVVDVPCPPGTFFDSRSGALHLLTTASLATACREHPSGAWAVARFRPNLVIDAGPEADGYPEDDWVGERVRVGEAELVIRKATGRCIVTTRAQPGLPRDLDVLRSLHRAHEGNLGVYAQVLTTGRVAEGDPVEIG